MEIQIRQATIQDLNVLMQWRMEVLHEVFSIPSEQIGRASCRERV